MKKDFLSILDITKTELDEIISGAERLKRQKRAGYPRTAAGHVPCNDLREVLHPDAYLVRSRHA